MQPNCVNFHFYIIRITHAKALVVLINKQLVMALAFMCRDSRPLFRPAGFCC